MSRRVDPARHAARRLQIVDAALTCFAADGYDGATTASICRTAGIGSGTFFHYFPTKVDVLLAVLELGAQETEDWFASQRGRSDARQVLSAWAEWSADELADARVAGFVRAVGSVMTLPAVAEALRADERVQREGLLHWVRLARDQGQVRNDLSADSLTRWLLLVVDGFAGAVAGDDGFTAADQRGTLLDSIDRLLAPR